MRNTTFRDDVLPFFSSIGIHTFLILIAILTAAAAPPLVRYLSKEMTYIPTTEFRPDTDNKIFGQGGVYAGLGKDIVNFKIDEDETRLEPIKGNGLPAKLGFDEYGDGNFNSTGMVNPLAFGNNRLGNGKEGTGMPGLPFGYRHGDPRGTSIFNPASSGSLKGARLIIYICDASGSMLTDSKFDMVRLELKKCINGLTPVHGFNVILFQDDNLVAVDKTSLMVANGTNKEKVDHFLDNTMPRGQTNVIPSLELAFRQKPELIWLLTDGDFPDNKAVIDYIRSHNLYKVKINTIAFVDRGKLYEEVLRTIASDTGGEYKFVSRGELNK